MLTVALHVGLDAELLVRRPASAGPSVRAARVVGARGRGVRGQRVHLRRVPRSHDGHRGARAPLSALHCSALL